MRFSITAVLGVALVGSAVADPGVSPALVDTTADPGSSFKIDKVVTTPEIPPRPDVVLLVDVTSSMGSAIGNIKTNLDKVVQAVTAGQPSAKFAVVSFGDLRDPNGFKVVRQLTDDVPALQSAVNSLKAELGRDTPEDWINALFQVSTGAVAFRDDSSRIIVLVGDAPSHDPSGDHTLGNALDALLAARAKVIGVNVNALDATGQATAVTAATGGVILGTAADAVTKAIISGLKNLDVTVRPDVVTCDADLTLAFAPAETRVASGSTVTFAETVAVSADAEPDARLHCAVRFLLDGTAGGDAYVQTVNVTANVIGCDTCDPRPGKNRCHGTTSCAPTPFGTMCLTRPGYKADGVDDDDLHEQWRLKWSTPGHEHRIAVKPGRSADTLCDKKNKGSDVCKEVSVGRCPKPKSADAGHGAEQKVIGGGEL